MRSQIQPSCWVSSPATLMRSRSKPSCWVLRMRGACCCRWVLIGEASQPLSRSAVMHAILCDVAMLRWLASDSSTPSIQPCIWVWPDSQADFTLHPTTQSRSDREPNSSRPFTHPLTITPHTHPISGNRKPTWSKLSPLCTQSHKITPHTHQISVSASLPPSLRTVSHTTPLHTHTRYKLKLVSSARCIFIPVHRLTQGTHTSALHHTLSDNL